MQPVAWAVLEPPDTVRFQISPMPLCHQPVLNKFLFLSLLNGDFCTLGDPGRKLVCCVCWLLQLDELENRAGGI